MCFHIRRLVLELDIMFIMEGKFIVHLAVAQFAYRVSLPYI